MMVKIIRQNNNGRIEQEMEFDGDRFYYFVYNNENKQIGQFSWLDEADECLEALDKN